MSKKFFGKVGYATSVKVGPGIYEELIKEVSYKGEELKKSRNFNAAESVLGKITYPTRLSILADAYALKNYADIRYVQWAEAFYTVSEIDVERPRLIITIGEKYNGKRPEEND